MFHQESLHICIRMMARKGPISALQHTKTWQQLCISNMTTISAATMQNPQCWKRTKSNLKGTPESRSLIKWLPRALVPPPPSLFLSYTSKALSLAVVCLWNSKLFIITSYLGLGWQMPLYSSLLLSKIIETMGNIALFCGNADVHWALSDVDHLCLHSWQRWFTSIPMVG